MTDPTQPDGPSDDAAGPETAPMEGAVLGGRYRLQLFLGRGGMAEVWQATDEVLGRRVAVKLFTRGMHENRQRSEMQMLAGLTHPGLVTVYDAGLADEVGGGQDSYLVMELVEGPTLRRGLDVNGPMPSSTTALLGRQLAAALSYVHGRGIVHRDVKPANILLTSTRPGDGSDTWAKLTDFGIARLLDSERMTEHGQTMGTANYLSPEQVTGREVGPPSDVYSLGLVLMECLTGEVVYPGHGVEAAVVRLTRPPRLPDRFGPAWTQLLAAMTDSDPTRRPTAAAVAAALRSPEDGPLPPTGAGGAGALGAGALAAGALGAGALGAAGALGVAGDRTSALPPSAVPGGTQRLPAAANVAPYAGGTPPGSARPVPAGASMFGGPVDPPTRGGGYPGGPGGPGGRGGYPGGPDDEDARRRRLLIVLASLFGVLVVAGLVIALVLANGSGSGSGGSTAPNTPAGSRSTGSSQQSSRSAPQTQPTTPPTTSTSSSTSSSPPDTSSSSSTSSSPPDTSSSSSTSSAPGPPGPPGKTKSKGPGGPGGGPGPAAETTTSTPATDG